MLYAMVLMCKQSTIDYLSLPCYLKFRW